MNQRNQMQQMREALLLCQQADFKKYILNTGETLASVVDKALAAESFNFRESMRQTIERFEHLPEGSKADYQRASPPIERAPLVRLTDEEIRAAFEEGNKRYLQNEVLGTLRLQCGYAIMDAMERVNRRQLDQTPKTPSE